MQDDPTGEMKNKQVKENNINNKWVAHNVPGLDIKFSEDYATYKIKWGKWMRAMAKELSRRFHEKKCLNVLKSVHYVVHDLQMSGPLHENPSLVLRNQRTTIHDSQNAGTSTNMIISLVVRNDSKNIIGLEKIFGHH
jgi:hypothetical protein